MMNSRWTLVLAVAALTLAAGCGKGDEQTTRFNTVLGGSAAPTSPGIGDKGILSDATAYKPAVRTGDLGAGGGGAPTGATGAEDSPESLAVKRSMTVLIDDIGQLNAAGLLTAFDPAKTEALTKVDFESSLINVASALENTFKTIRAKSPAEQQTQIDAMLAIAPDALRLLTSGKRVVLGSDGETAMLFIDPPSEAAVDEFLGKHGEALVGIVRTGLERVPPEALPPQFGAVKENLSVDTLKQMVAALQDARALARKAAQESGAAPPDAAGDTPGSGIPFRKVNDRWVIDLPFAVTDELAEGLKEGATLLNEALAGIAAAVEAAPSLEDPSLQMALLPVVAPLIEWSGRIQMLVEEAMAGGGQPKPAEVPANPEDAPANPRNPRQPSGDGPVNP